MPPKSQTWKERVKSSKKSSRASAWVIPVPGDESSSSSSSEDDIAQMPDLTHIDLPPDYWQIQKLVRYVKTGNPTATLIALCGLKDYDLRTEINQMAVKDAGGLEVLLNILDCEGENSCRIGALQLLCDLCSQPYIRLYITDIAGLPPIVRTLFDESTQLQALAADTIANAARFRWARDAVREHGGIERLVDLLDASSREVQRSAAQALWSLSPSRCARAAIRRAGGVPLLARLLKTTNAEVLIPVVGIIRECASDRSYQLEFRTEGMIRELVSNLHVPNLELCGHCASAIYRCAADAETRALVRHHGGLQPLVELLQYENNAELVAAATGAIWMCSMDPDSMQILVDLGIIGKLVSLLQSPHEELLVNAVGALNELCIYGDNRVVIRRLGGITRLVAFLTSTNVRLLINSALALGGLANDPEVMVQIEQVDGVRLLWSLMKNSHPEVQAAAAKAICPCVRNARDSAEMVRSFVGGLEVIVGLLKSPHIPVLSAAAEALSEIASDDENLSVLTDHGAVHLLARLASHSDPTLRKNVANAIAQCCSQTDNSRLFGEENAVAPLVSYLRSNDLDVRRAGTKALYYLSLYSRNCVTMHQHGVLDLLLELMASPDEQLKKHAAGCLQNVRHLALSAERRHLERLARQKLN